MKISQVTALRWLLSIGYILSGSGLAYAAPAKGLDYDFPSVGAFQRGSWEVWVANPPAPAAPREPFQAYVSMPLPSGLSSLVKDIIVPDGKRLTIEYITAEAAVPSGQIPRFQVLAGLSPNATRAMAIPNAILTNMGALPADFYVVNQATLLFAGPGNSVSVLIDRKGPNPPGAVDGWFSIMGHLEPAN